MPLCTAALQLLKSINWWSSYQPTCSNYFWKSLEVELGLIPRTSVAALIIPAPFLFWLTEVQRSTNAMACRGCCSPQLWAAATPLSTRTATSCCHCWHPRRCWWAAEGFVSPCLPPVFVYLGITGMTLQSSTMPVGGNGLWPTVPQSSRSSASEWQQWDLSLSAGLASHGVKEKWEIKRHQAC